MKGRKAGQVALLFSIMASPSLQELVHLWILILLERNTNRTCPGNREKMLFDMWIRPCWQTEHLPDTASKLRHLEKWAPHSSRALPPVSVSHLLTCGDPSHFLVKVQHKKRTPVSLLKSLPSLHATLGNNSRDSSTSSRTQASKQYNKYINSLSPDPFLRPLLPETTFFSPEAPWKAEDKDIICTHARLLAVWVFELPKRRQAKRVLNLASPEWDSTDVRLQHGACKSSTLTSIYSQSRETAAKSISQPKRDFKKVILSHDLFILFLHGTKLSDSYAEPREGGKKKKQKENLKAHVSGALLGPRKWPGCVWRLFEAFQVM